MIQQQNHSYEELRIDWTDGWPIQVWFWLEWGSSTAGQSLPAAGSRFRAVHPDSISASSRPGEVTTASPSTPRIIALIREKEDRGPVCPEVSPCFPRNQNMTRCSGLRCSGNL